jgi:signal-transduction protein with cAMP-binding, CBS, and nucleotidyltransferase domain
MQVTEILSLPRGTVDQLLGTIPFYKEVKDTEPWQYEVLLQKSRIVNYEPGELVIANGDVDTWMYYVLKGSLEVFSGTPEEPGERVNEITPGESFGDLAMLVEGKRMATVKADTVSKEVKVFGTDFSIFGKLDDFTILSLKTKLIFYRRMVHGIRWKLEQYKMNNPTHRLVGKLKDIKLYLGPKDGVEELQAHFQQAKDLSALLTEWNKEFGNFDVKVDEPKEFDPSVVDDLDLS